jgi:hypothetical protein
MARDNGGIIGPVNDPTNTSASGVWSLEEQYQAQLAGNWPSAPTPFSTNSLRFNDGSSDYLSRTPSSAGNTKTLTISMWVKLSAITTNRHLICEEGGGTDKIDEIKISNADVIRIENYNDSGSDYGLVTNQVLRDTSAWYHIVVAFDSTQATAADRIKLYVNGSQVTSFSSSSYPSLNYDFYWNSNTDTIGIGADTRTPTNYFDGYMSEVILVDGQQLDATSFGVSDANGVWTPIKYTGTFGTNGFQLQFGNAAALGTDSSPNGNDFTVNNLTSIDQTTDYPVNNFATMNALVPTGSLAFSNGNTTLTGSNDTLYASNNNSTLGVSAGKYYAEVEYDTAGGNTSPTVGVTPITTSATTNTTGSVTDAVVIRMDNDLYVEGVTTSAYLGSTPSAGDIIGIALDLDNGKVWFSLNGTFVGDPVAGTGAAFDGITSGETMCFCTRALGAVFKWNFGNGYFGTTAVSSAQNPDDGIGIFEYDVPTGYRALCTKSINAEEYS